MAAQLINIQFHDQTLTAALVEGVPHVAMKPLCENIGLQWESQYNRIKRHPVLSSTIFMTNIVAEDGKNREMLMLPLDYLNGWLFGVDASRVKPEIKPRLLDYQRECFKVLAKHFLPKRNGLKRGPVENPELLHVTPLELDALVQRRAAQLLEGEVIVKEKDCPRYDAPLSLWDLQNRVGGSGWLTFPEYARVEPHLRPIARLLQALNRDGHDVAGAKTEYDAVKHLLESFYIQLDTLRRVFESLDKIGLNIRFG